MLMAKNKGCHLFRNAPAVPELKPRSEIAAELHTGPQAPAQAPHATPQVLAIIPMPPDKTPVILPMIDLLFFMLPDYFSARTFTLTTYSLKGKSLPMSFTIDLPIGSCV